MTWQNQQSECAPSWSESSLSAWRNLGPLAIHWAHSEDSDQTGRMPRLIWVFAGRTLILLVLSCRGSFRIYVLVLSSLKCYHSVAERWVPTSNPLDSYLVWASLWSHEKVSLDWLILNCLAVVTKKKKHTRTEFVSLFYVLIYLSMLP